jgi:hypothetical protein
MKIIFLGALLALPFITFAAVSNPTTQTATFVGTTGPAPTTEVEPIRATAEPVKVEPILAEPVSAPTPTPTSVAPKPTEPQQASTDYLIKLPPIDGESSEKKGSDVDKSWKVEEGESAAAADMFIKFDGVDGESEARGGVNVATGDINGDGRDDLVVIDVQKLRSMDLEKKKEALDKAPKTPDEVRDSAGLTLFAASLADGDPMMEQISLNYEKIKVEYRSKAKFLWVIPMDVVVAVDARLDAETGDPTIEVTYPWYAFLMSKVPANDIQIGAEEAVQKKDKGRKGEISIESYSFGANNASLVLQSIAETLKSVHGTMQSTN